MNDALRRGACDKGFTDIMYVTIEYLNHPIISLLTQPRGNCAKILWPRNSSFLLPDLNSNSHHPNSIHHNWATTHLQWNVIKHVATVKPTWNKFYFIPRYRAVWIIKNFHKIYILFFRQRLKSCQRRYSLCDSGGRYSGLRWAYCVTFHLVSLKFHSRFFPCAS